MFGLQFVRQIHWFPVVLRVWRARERTLSTFFCSSLSVFITSINFRRGIHVNSNISSVACFSAQIFSCCYCRIRLFFYRHQITRNVLNSVDFYGICCRCQRHCSAESLMPCANDDGIYFSQSCLILLT